MNCPAPLHPGGLHRFRLHWPIALSWDGARKECQVTRKIEANASREGQPAVEKEGRVDQESSEPMFLRRKSHVSQGSSSPNQKTLSKRECEVVRLLAEGNSSKEIATLLNIAVTTVETYRARIMMKLGVHSVVQLVRYAVENKLVRF
jgi:DNA-binding NarL/FixJ family response regulator